MKEINIMKQMAKNNEYQPQKIMYSIFSEIMYKKTTTVNLTNQPIEK